MASSPAPVSRVHAHTTVIVDNKLSLRKDEEGWKDTLNRLCERFPTVAEERILQSLRTADGHAGSAAAELRDLTSYNVKQPDPDDVNHVATLLSSPMIFKHAVKEQFKKFDVNGDGVLDKSEVVTLTNSMYHTFGLKEPSEACLKAFFDVTDENHDGVLSEREFRKFFEMFLRHAFFDVAKLQELVDKGQTTVGRLNAEDLARPPKPQPQPMEPQRERNPSLGQSKQDERHSAPDQTGARKVAAVDDGDISSGTPATKVPEEYRVACDRDERHHDRGARKVPVVNVGNASSSIPATNVPEEYRVAFDRLMERFPNAGRARILQALQENDGHAGKVASVLRDIS